MEASIGISTTSLRVVLYSGWFGGRPLLECHPMDAKEVSTIFIVLHSNINFYRSCGIYCSPLLTVELSHAMRNSCWIYAILSLQ
jgi:hypothetical protein